jgi:integrase
MAGRTLTSRRTTGIEPRHARSCTARGWDDEGVCNCSPTFQAQVYDRRSKRIIRKTFPTLATAKSWRADAGHAVKKGTMGAPSKQTFGEAADDLLEGMKSGAVRNRNRKPYKPSVIRTYEVWLDARLRPTFGGSKLADLCRNDFQDYAEELLVEGLDPSTVRNVLMPARVIYKRAVRRGDVAINPTSELELPAVEGVRDRVADAKEAVELLAALPEDDRPIWATAIYAGLRLGELRALRVEDIDLDAGTIDVSRSWDEVEGVIEPKSKAGTRVIPLCDHLSVYLKAHLAGLGWDAGLVFGESATRPFDYGKTTRRAYSAWKSAKLARLVLHEARHSFRSYLDAIAVISDTRIDRYMGHADASMKARYSHAFKTQLAADAAALDEYLEGATAGKIVPLIVPLAATV